MSRKKATKIGICNICGEETELYALGRCRSCYHAARYHKTDDASQIKSKRRAPIKIRYPSEETYELQKDNLQKVKEVVAIVKATPKADRLKKCLVCKVEDAEVAGLCRSCYKHYLNNKDITVGELIELRTHRVGRGNRKYPPWAKCALCKSKPIYSHNLCKNCYNIAWRCGVRSAADTQKLMSFITSHEEQLEEVIPVMRKKK